VRRVRAALERWSIMESLLRSLPRQPDLVFFAYLDCMLAPGLAPMMVDRAFSYPWTGVYLHPIWTRIGRRLPMQLREGWALRARRCNGVGLLDEGLLPRFERMLPRKQVCQVPDFISERTEASVTGPHAEILRRAAGRTVVGMVGTLQSRKGLATLLRAALDPRGSRFFFVFAGQLSLDNFGEEDRALIRQVQNEAPENCYVRTSSIDCERSFVSIAQACDILFAAYHAFPHSSNILALASLLRRPVIVSQGHLMEERALRYKLGPAIPEADPQATLDAISSLDADLHSPHPHKRFFESYLRVHSRARLQTTMRILIDGDDKAKPEHTEAGSSLPAA
jgi:glycosyltransferase involved in cell wall biosynthesis